MDERNGQRRIDDATWEALRAVGARIRSLRGEADLTQEQLAAKIGMDWKRLQRVEAGKVNATMNTLVRVARGLGVEITSLFSSEVPPSE